MTEGVTETVSVPTSNVSLSLPAGELSRVIQLLVAKAGGDPPFSMVDLQVTSEGIGSEHQEGSVGLKASYSAFGSAGTIATNDPNRLFDYIKAFPPLEPITLTQNGGKLTIEGKSKRTTMGAIDPSIVPRSNLPKPWGMGPNGCWVMTSSDHRPADLSAWSDWTAKGYVVLTIPVEELQSLVSDAKNIYKRYKGALVRFIVVNGKLKVQIQENGEQTADRTDVELLANVHPGTPDCSVGIMFDTVEPLWSSLSNSSASEVTMIHHINERRVNFLVAEKELHLTSYCGVWNEGQ